MLNITNPPELDEHSRQIIDTGKNYLSGTEIPSLAYDLVQKTAPHDMIAKAYGINTDQLLHEIQNNLHLQAAIKDTKRQIAEDGALTVGMRTLVGETLPYILRDNKDSLTDPSTRSRNTQMALNYLASEQKAKDAKELAATNHGMASGMTVNFNVTSGIRGISTPEAITITQDNEQ